MHVEPSREQCGKAIVSLFDIPSIRIKRMFVHEVSINFAGSLQLQSYDTSLQKYNLQFLRFANNFLTTGFWMIFVSVRWNPKMHSVNNLRTLFAMTFFRFHSRRR